MRNRLALRYAIEGDLRFISHHDSLRLFERALARCGMPVAYSQGYNPLPRLRIVLPRPVGVASQDEWVLMDMAAPVEPWEALARLASQMPAGLRLLAAEVVAEHDRWAPYEVSYSLPIGPDEVEPAGRRATAFMAMDQVLVKRVTPKTRSPKMLDVRRFIEAVEVSSGSLVWRQSISPEGTARPAEVLEVLGFAGQEHLHRLRRVSIGCRR